MDLRTNLHTHTNFSDGKNSAEEMALAAIDRGFESLGFSDHAYVLDGSFWCMPQEKEPAYCAEVLRLKEKYRDQIEIVLGYEHDFDYPGSNFEPYEYVIESVHRIRKNGEFLDVDHTRDILMDFVARQYGGNYYAMTRDYFYNVVCSCTNPHADIIGHIDLVTKFNEGDCLFDTSDPRYMMQAEEALRCVANRDLILEINTGAMSRGYRKTPYPAPRLLKRFREMGGRICINSDCHRAEWLDFGFDFALELARDCGYKEIWVYRNGAFQPAGI